MAKKRAPTTKETLPPDVDDLKLITGIGPAVEHRLHGVGVFTFTQLAAMSPADIAALVGDISGLTAERISKQDWIGQARALATPRKAAAEPAALPQPAQESRSPSEKPQHTATFTIELTLNEARQVLSTELVHVQSRQREQLIGWQESQLLHFLVQQAKIALPTAAIRATMGEMTELSSTGAPVPVSPLPEEEQPFPAAAPANQSALRLLEVETVLVDGGSAQSVLFADQPFDVRFFLDLDDEGAPPRESYPRYTASVFARKLGEHTRQPIAEAQGTLQPESVPVVHVKDITLSPGTYRLEARLSLHARNGGADTSPVLTATKKGSLLQIVQGS